MSGHEKWLREAAIEIAAAGHAGWGNTCTQAAEAFSKLQAEVDTALTELKTEVERLKRACEAQHFLTSAAEAERDALKSWQESVLAEVGQEPRPEDYGATFDGVYHDWKHVLFADKMGASDEVLADLMGRQLAYFKHHAEHLAAKLVEAQREIQIIRTTCRAVDLQCADELISQSQPQPL